MGVQDFITSLSENQVFGAGAGLVGLGVGTAVLRKSLMVATIMFRRHCVSEIEVSIKDPSYYPLLLFLKHKGMHQTKRLSVSTTYSSRSAVGEHTRFDFMPKVGEHFIWYKGTPIRVERTREHKLDSPWENLTLSCLGNKFSSGLFPEMLEEAHELQRAGSAGLTQVLTPGAGQWMPWGQPQRPRPLGTVVLRQGLTEVLSSDVTEFLREREWYQDRGVPYRRGYLLHGPPGCGKTSFIQALAGHLQLDICLMSLSDRGMTGDRLRTLLSAAPQDSIVLLEDVDALFVNREDEDAAHSSRYQGLASLSLSDFLNALDGVTSPEGRIVFMTTNYVHRLDPAMIRPGRVDVNHLVDYCSEWQLRQLFVNFYSKESEHLCDSFVKAVGGGVVSPAAVQGHLMCHKRDPEGAVREAHCLGTGSSAASQVRCNVAVDVT